MSAVPPIRREVLVPASPAIAFAVFTEQLGRWWPLGELSVHHDGTVAFIDGRIVEYAADGREAVWGEVTEWAPPATLSFTWHPGRAASGASRVTVRFDENGDETLVTLVHDGWEAFADPAAARAEYDHGWPRVLEGYAAASACHETATWMVLRHTANASPGTVFGDPRFAGHAAFLDRMRRAGYLVAAGPLEAAGMEGMTILRLPGAGRADEARRLAEGDASVVEGLFTLDARPWRVVSTG